MQSLANVHSRGLGWQHHHEHEDHHQYLIDNRYIQEDVGGVQARDVSLADMRKGAYDPPTGVVLLQNGSNNHSNSRIREPKNNKKTIISCDFYEMSFYLRPDLRNQQHSLDREVATAIFPTGDCDLERDPWRGLAEILRRQCRRRIRFCTLRLDFGLNSRSNGFKNLWTFILISNEFD